MTSPTRPARRAAAVLLAVLAGVLLSACNPVEAGAAAVVGPDRITETALNQRVLSAVDAGKAVGAADPAPSAPLIRANLGSMVRTDLYELAAQRESITVTQADVDRLISESGGRKQVEEGLLAQNGVPPAAIDAEARSFLISQRLGQKLAPGQGEQQQAEAAGRYLSALSREVGVTVNPRYGRWDAETLQIVDAASDLSTPAASVQPR